MEEQIEIMQLLKSKQILELQLDSLAYGFVEIKEFIKEKCHMKI